MVFSSLSFLFSFLPACYIGFLCIRMFDRERLTLAWLIGMSSLFYGLWSTKYLALLLLLILYNYLLHAYLVKSKSRLALILGIAANLACLGYLKYYGFLIANLNAVGLSLAHDAIVLPLAISFFTFQKIALLIETYVGTVSRISLSRFFFIILFFPQLISGPLVRPHEIVPQLARWGMRHDLVNASVGATLFVIGLFKKVVIADSVAPYSDFIFDLAANGYKLPGVWVWTGVLCYTFQIYFDFSGYSDMAIGLARMFGFRFPQNFASPYQADSIVDFWRRWHMTLSRFLRDYLYIPLGGSRRGELRHYMALLITMLLGGLWHGANWTFILWGAYHGVLLALNHALRRFVRVGVNPFWMWPRRIVVFALVSFGWILFRADSLSSAWSLMQSAVGIWGWVESVPASRMPGYPGPLQDAQVTIVLLLAIVWLLPNSQEIVRAYRPTLADVLRAPLGLLRIEWRPSWKWALAMSAVAVLACVKLYAATSISPFIYFQF